MWQRSVRASSLRWSMMLTISIKAAHRPGEPFWAFYWWSSCLPNWLLLILTYPFRWNFCSSLKRSKPFDRIWHISLLIKLPSYEFYPSHCPLISSSLYDLYICAVVDGHFSYHKPINWGVPQGTVLSPSLSLCCSLMIFTNFPFHTPMTLLCITQHLLMEDLRNSNYTILGWRPQNL